MLIRNGFTCGRVMASAQASRMIADSNQAVVILIQLAAGLAAPVAAVVRQV